MLYDIWTYFIYDYMYLWIFIFLCETFFTGIYTQVAQQCLQSTKKNDYNSFFSALLMLCVTVLLGYTGLSYNYCSSS